MYKVGIMIISSLPKLCNKITTTENFLKHILYASIYYTVTIVVITIHILSLLFLGKQIFRQIDQVSFPTSLSLLNSKIIAKKCKLSLIFCVLGPPKIGHVL